MTTPTFAIITITPDQAKIVVENTLRAKANIRSPYNATADRDRAGLTPHAKGLGWSMIHDEWAPLDAPPIRLSDLNFNGSTVCTDGLHRLAACGWADKPLETMVLVGEKFAAGDFTDIDGKQRTIADLLKADGVPQAGAMGALGRSLLNRAVAIKTRRTIARAADQISTRDVHRFVLKHVDPLAMALGRARRIDKFGLNRTGAAVVFAELHMYGDPDYPEMLLGDLLDDDATTPGRVMRAHVQKRFLASSKAMTQPWTTANLIRVWDLDLVGTRPKIWRPADPLALKHPDGCTP